MNWQPELDELRSREKLARRMGGPDKVKRQHDGGRLTVRERIDRLLDAGSFHEIGALAGRANYDAHGNLTDLVPANCVFGRGAIEGRPVVVVGLGSVAGLGAARLAASHYSVMTKSTSPMFVAGPPVVARLGEKLEKKELGGWEIQTRSGAVDHAVDTEDEASYWGSLPLEGGIEAAYRADLDAAPDPAAKLKEIEDRLNLLRSPFRTAETFAVEEIVDPRDTRRLVCEFAGLVEPLRTPQPPRFGARP